MAGNLPVTNVFQLKLTWTQSGTPSALNILHFLESTHSPMTQAKADSLSTIVKTSFTNSGHAGNVWSSVALATVEARDLTSNTNPFFVGAGAAVPGTSAANPLPAATACVVSLPTGMRGRSFNGRVYLWGFTEDANDVAGGITAAAGSAAVAFITNITTAISSTHQANIAVLSRFTTPPGATEPTERNPPIASPASTVVLKDNRWDVQRRRAVPGI